jgi:hypothetical protein
MQERLLEAGLKRVIDEQADEVVSKRFVGYMQKSDWREKAKQLAERLETRGQKHEQ